MNLLVLEDNPNERAFLQKELERIPNLSVTYAASKRSAIAALENEVFQLVILDLRIPTVDGGTDEHGDHGLAVLSFIEEKAQGTPVIIFSAHWTMSLVRDRLEKSEHHDLWGTGNEQSVISFKDKSELAACIAAVESAVKETSALSEIEISEGAEPCNLNQSHKILLRKFARLNHGVNVRVAKLGGGLSSARTLRITVYDQHGTVSSLAVAKLGLIGELKQEKLKYEQYISPVLASGDFAHLITFLKTCAGGYGGLFYYLAHEYDTLTSLMKREPARASDIVAKLKKIEKVWQPGTIKMMSIAVIRRALVSDEILQPFAPLLGADWQEFEKQHVRVNWCTQHRDFHGLNILVDANGDPLLIDYGLVDKAPAPLDALTLELCFVFHPDCRKIAGAWPDLDTAKKWDNLEDFVRGCPFPGLVTSCRLWAAAAAEAGDKGLYATAYSYALRQLKYDASLHGQAIAIALAAKNRILKG
jgi:CheY-like chemotaxis protein